MPEKHEDDEQYIFSQFSELYDGVIIRRLLLVAMFDSPKEDITLKSICYLAESIGFWVNFRLIEKG